MLEEELLELSHLADILCGHFDRGKLDVSLSEILNQNPELLKALYVYSHDKERAQILLKMIEEKEKNDRGNREQSIS